MNPDFKLKLDQMLQSDPTKEDTNPGTHDNRFFTPYEHVRNLCFVWPDGRKKFLNYSFLVSAQYSPSESTIKLVFTTETVLLKGIRLEALFQHLQDHTIKQVSSIDYRYNAIHENEDIIVNEIEIQTS
jgi:hypothetical protein